MNNMLLKKYFKKRSWLLFIILLACTGFFPLASALFLLMAAFVIFQPTGTMVDNIVFAYSDDAKERAIQKSKLSADFFSKRAALVFGGYDDEGLTKFKYSKKDKLVRTDMYTETVLLFADTELYCYVNKKNIFKNDSLESIFKIPYTDILDIEVSAASFKANNDIAATHIFTLNTTKATIITPVFDANRVQNEVNNIRMMIQ